MAETRIRAARSGDERAIAEMMALLWPDGSLEEFRAEALTLLETGMSGTMAGAILLACDQHDRPLGFLQVGLRSHADGCDASCPAGFVEGWFVHDHARKQGIGRALMLAAEEWSRTKGCLEIASDALVNNAPSSRAHEATGFEVVDRCVHFRKKL